MTTTSFIASGTPASGPSGSPAARRASTAGGGGQRAIGVDVQECLELAVDLGDPIEVRAGHLGRAGLAVPDGFRRLGGRQLVQAGHYSSSPRICGTRNRSSSTAGAPASTASRGRHGAHLVWPEDVLQRHGVRGGLDVAGSHLADPGDGAEDHVELAGEQVEFVVGDGQPGQPGQVRDFFAGDGGGIFGHEV